MEFKIMQNEIIEEADKNKCYTVYMHTAPNGKRYIGITCLRPEKRWRNGEGYKTQVFYRAIQKYGFENFKHEILYTNLSKDEAEMKEIELIAYYQSDNSDYGYNVEHGGNCIGKISEETKRKIGEKNKGRIPSEETRKKLSEATSGVNNPFYGKHHTDETKRKLSESHKGLESKLKGVPKTEEAKQKMSEAAKIRFYNSENHPMLGMNHTAESKQKMSASHKGLKQSEEHRKHNGESHKKPIVQFSKSLEFIKVWDSATDAANELGGNATCIAACCRKRASSAYGFIWRYVSDIEDITNPHLPYFVKSSIGR